jgi:hypothetical protein
LSTNIAPKVDLVLAVGRLQGQSSIGRLGLVALDVHLGLERLGISKLTEKCRQVRVLGTSVTLMTRRPFSAAVPRVAIVGSGVDIVVYSDMSTC